ncbi:alpha/beta fold hydrolase [Pseudohoeflea coraliihabitans]|uniref:Alpha/beta hydrolase n=1 Tax=Pseudohoeflea coraliihabitans TaxID=2860393 RepID=A0ABS6WJT4_9HYPH|nr:alpha/beta hydrolase [Pseudohoeflea sp. DP4N28-3]MBW3095727.1 alpha/beta hydrolase [Pseudohoeflea sp. DP4N28-3]
MTDLLPGFDSRHVEGANGCPIHLRIGGAGPALFLLHGYPQSHATWHRIAPQLAEQFTVIVPDLRGYGESGAPVAAADGSTYAKRTMGADIFAVADRLGIERFALVGHDRGARVAYRMAFDRPQRIDRLAIIEVVPTAEMWAHFDARMGLKAYHWTFLAQPEPLPETLIAADPTFYVDWTLKSWTAAQSLETFSPGALASYRAAFQDPARVAAMCWDYRAGAGVDRALDEADRAAGRKIAVPLHFIWSAHGFPAKTGDPLAIWREWADCVTGSGPIDAGHFAMEENPQAVLDALLPFLADAD